MAYLSIFNRVDNKSSIQGEILKKDVTALNNQGRPLRNRAASTDFSFNL